MGREWLHFLWEHHRAKTLGALFGLCFSLMTILLGIWWTLFVWACILAGYLVGKHLDDEDATLMDVLDRFLPPGRR